jgi:hypothetical protein
MPLRQLANNSGQEFYPNHNTPSTAGGFNYNGWDGSFRQRDFKFGDGTSFDRPSEGFSREPFIGKNIELLGIEEEKGGAAFGFIDNLTDGLIRGGITTAISRTAKDVARIGKFYLSQRGIGFLAKSVGTQRTNPVIRELNESPGGGGGNILDQIGDAISSAGGSNSNQRVYNLGVNTAAQIAGAAFGLHIKREGLLPTSYEGYIDDIPVSRGSIPGGDDSSVTTIGTTLLPTGEPGEGVLKEPNRLIGLFGHHILNLVVDPEMYPQGSPAEGLNTGNLLEAASPGIEGLSDISDEMSGFGKFLAGGNSLGRQMLYDYSGGPDSLYGIGRTKIMKAATKFNTTGETTIGGRTFKLNDGSPWLQSSENYGYIADPGYQQIYTIKKYRHAVSTQATNNSMLEFDDGQISSYSPIFTVYETGKQNVSIEDNAMLHFAAMKDPSENIYGVDQVTPESPAKLQDWDLYSPYPYSGIDFNKVQDFRLAKRGIKPGSTGPDHTVTEDKDLQSPNSEATNYQQENVWGGRFYREDRVNTGNPGKRMDRRKGKNINEKDTMSYDLYDSDTIDKINALDIFTSDSKLNHRETRDLIQFRIEALNGDNPNKSDVMYFRAFLDNWGDNYTGKWNNFKYNGRAEEFYTYASFKRNLSFSFKIAAQTRHEMKPLYRKLNYLITQTAPDYKGTRMRGSFCRLTIGNLIERTPGFFTSVNIKWKKDYPWEIAINEPEGENKGKTPDDDGAQIVPHILDVQCKFTPIHNFIPKKSITQSPFILPRKWADSGVKTFSKANIGRQQQNTLHQIEFQEPKQVTPPTKADPTQNPRFNIEPSELPDHGKVNKKGYRLAEEAIRLPKKQLTSDSFKKALYDQEIKKAIDQGAGTQDIDMDNMA